MASLADLYTGGQTPVLPTATASNDVIVGLRFVGSNASAPPTVSAGPGAGTGTVSLGSNSADTAGALTVSPAGSPGSNNAVIATVNFNRSFPLPPSIALFPTSGASAFATNFNRIFVTPSTSNFTINCGGSNGLATTGIYAYNWVAMGRTTTNNVPTTNIVSADGSIIANSFVALAVTPPSVSLGVGAGGSGTFTLGANSADAAGTLSITPAGTGGQAPAQIASVATVVFNRAYVNAPSVILQPRNAAAAAAVYESSLNVISTPGGFQIFVGAPALVAGTTYSWDYIVVGRTA